MKFTVSTKPLVESLNLGIINSNISKFFEKSTMAQIQASGDTLKINLEALSILSEITLKGVGDGEDSIIFVDCALLKQLVGTFETATTTFEFTDNGLVIHSGKSKFTLPRMTDADMRLKAPELPTTLSAEMIELDKKDWKFVKDYQMYAISMSFVHPVYQCVWVSASNEVIVGDIDNSIFTYSDKGKLGTTCLLTDTIVNLFNSLPEGTKIVRNGDNYLIQVATDSYDLITEFTPRYEGREDVGYYNSDIIVDLLTSDESSSSRVDITPIKKVLDQALLLANNSTDDSVMWEASDKCIKLSNTNIDCEVPFEGTNPVTYSIEFQTALLRSFISNFPENVVSICPSLAKDEESDDMVVTGIIMKGKELTAVLGGLD